VTDDRPRLEIRSRAEWRAWLAEHHASSSGVWLITFKKDRGPYVPYDDIVEEALAFGWVDSKGLGVDEDRSGLLMTPRKPKSGWSRPNKLRIEKLTAAGLMAPAGLAAVALAKETGTWTALDDIENLVEPPDLTAALDANPDARRHWDAFPPSARKALLGWIMTAKRTATREKRVAETVAKAAVNERANEWKPRDGGTAAG
jgi:uncharacterized protein YdeI (YjbR/CyaY-like superfamily)